MEKEMDSIYQQHESISNTYKVTIIAISKDGQYAYVKKSLVGIQLIQIATDFLTPIELLYTEIELELCKKYNICNIDLSKAIVWKSQCSQMLYIKVEIEDDQDFCNLKKVHISEISSIFTNLLSSN